MNRKAFYTPQNFIAEKQDGTLVSIQDVVDTGDTEGPFRCKCCNAQVYPVAIHSVHMQPHFRHADGKSCIEYNESMGNGRTDAFWRRELELNRNELEYYKERIDALEYIWNIIEKDKESGELKHKDEFFEAFQYLYYDDQLFVYRYAAKTSCMKPIKREIRNLVNIGGIHHLNQLYPGVEVEANGLKSIKCTYKGKSIVVGDRAYDMKYNYRYDFPVRIDEKMLKDAKRQIEDLIDRIDGSDALWQKIVKYIRDHGDNTYLIRDLHVINSTKFYFDIFGLIESYRERYDLSRVRDVDLFNNFRRVSYQLTNYEGDFDQQMDQIIDDIQCSYHNCNNLLHFIDKIKKMQNHMTYKKEYWTFRISESYSTIDCILENDWEINSRKYHVTIYFDNAGKDGIAISKYDRFNPAKKVITTKSALTIENVLYPIMIKILKDRLNDYHIIASQFPFVYNKDIREGVISNQVTMNVLQMQNSDHEFLLYIPQYCFIRDPFKKGFFINMGMIPRALGINARWRPRTKGRKRRGRFKYPRYTQAPHKAVGVLIDNLEEVYPKKRVK